MRAWADHISTETNTEQRIEIHDAEFGGTPFKMKGVGPGWLQVTRQKLDPVNPLSDPIQKGGVKVTLWVQSEADQTLLSDILSANEKRFKIVYKSGDEEWEGLLLPDLTTYTEDNPSQVTLAARDLSFLAGVDYDFVSIPTLTRLSTIVADCLKETGLTLPIRSYTNLTNSEVTQADDFLYSLFHQKLALRNRNEPLTCLQVLEQICRTYNLLIKQVSGRWVIDQLPAVARGDDVQFDYDSDGLNPVSSTPDRTVAAQKILSSSINEVTGALKHARSTYNHRTPITDFAQDMVTHNSDTQTSRFMDIGEGNQRLVYSVDVTMESETGPGMGPYVEMQIVGLVPGEPEQYLTDAGAWTATPTTIQIDIDEFPEVGIGEGSFEVTSDLIPSGVTQINFRYLWGENPEGGAITEVRFENITSIVVNTTEADFTASIGHRYTRLGDYSLTEQIDPVLLGGGPTLFSRGAPATGAALANTIPAGNFRIRGEGENVQLERLTLRERVNMRRGALRTLVATMIADATAENLISYDGSTWYILGDDIDGYTGLHVAYLMELGYDAQEGDEFAVIIESGGDPTGSSGAATTQGLTIAQGDSRYFRRSQSLAEGVPETLRDNLSVPARSLTLTAGNGLTGGGTLQENRTFTLGDPSTLTVSTTNGTTGDSHTHSLDLSGRTLTAGDGLDGGGNLGANRSFSVKTASPLAIASDNVSLNFNEPLYQNGDNLDVRVHDDTRSGVISPSTQTIFGQKNFHGTIQSPDHVARLTGWRGTPTGLFDMRRLFTDELIARSFISDTTLSLAGTDFLSKSNAVLAEDVSFTPEDDDPYLWADGTPREWADETPFTWANTVYEITVEEHPGNPGFMVFEAFDYVLLRARDSFGGDGLRIINIWGRVNSGVDNEDGTQTYKFTLLNPNRVDPSIVVRAGSVALDYGKDGQGVIERSALLDNSPYDRIFTWHDRPWKTELYEVATNVGNDGAAPSGEPGKYGVYVKDIFRAEFNDGGLRFGRNADGQGNPGLYIDEDNYFLLNRGFKATVGGEVTPDNIIASINASTEGIDIQGDRIRLTGDTTIDGSFEVSGGNVRITEDTVFESNVTIRGSLDGVDGTFSGDLSAAGGTFSGALSAVSGTFTGTLDGAEGSFSGTLDAVNGSFGSVFIEPSGSLELSGAGVLNNGGLFLGTSQVVQFAPGTVVSAGLRYTDDGMELFDDDRDIFISVGFSANVHIGGTAHARFGYMGVTRESSVGSGDFMVERDAFIIRMVPAATRTLTRMTYTSGSLQNGDWKCIMNRGSSNIVLSTSSGSTGRFARALTIPPHSMGFVMFDEGAWIPQTDA